MGEATKKFLCVNRRAPHGTVYAAEGLELALMGAAFQQSISMAFLDDGVYQLKKGQDVGGLEVKNFARTFRALEDYSIEKICVEAESMEMRGLTHEDLLIPVEVLDKAELVDLIEEQDVLLNF